MKKISYEEFYQRANSNYDHRAYFSYYYKYRPLMKFVNKEREISIHQNPMTLEYVIGIQYKIGGVII